MTIAIYIWILIPSLLILSFIATRMRNSKAANKKWAKEDENILPEEVVDDSDNSFVFVRYRGEVLSMRKFEKLTYWDGFNRQERNEHIEGVKKAMKRGEVRREWLDEEKTICGYVPVKANLKKVLEDYKAFKSMGGQIIEE